MTRNAKKKSERDGRKREKRKGREAGTKERTVLEGDRAMKERDNERNPWTKSQKCIILVKRKMEQTRRIERLDYYEKNRIEVNRRASQRQNT